MRSAQTTGRRWQGALIAVALVAGLLASMPAALADSRPTEDPITNPDLETSCGLNILLILDESRSVLNAGAVGDVRRAFKAFTDALKNTSSSMAVAEFATQARLPRIGAFTPGEYITITDATKTQLDDYVDNEYDPGALSRDEYYTNWEDALRMGIPNHAPRPDPVIPHLTVLITDGEPNRIIRNSVSDFAYANTVPLALNQIASTNANNAADRAVANANNLKRQGSHILAIAVGDGLDGAGSLNRLEKVSGPDVFDGTGTFDIATDDIYREPDFSKLEEALREAAFQLCAPSVTIQKLVDETPDPGSIDDAVPGVGWDIEGEPTVSGGYDWVLPDDTAAPGPVVTQTDGAGFATFQWNTNLPTSSGFVATETIQSGYTNDQSQTQCTFRTPDTPDAPLPLDSVGDGTFAITIPPDAIVTCLFVNVAEPAPSITLEKRTQGQDADTPPGPVIPVGDPVDWDYIVTNTGNTSLRDIEITDSEVLPTGAPGPTVTCDTTTLSPGASTTCAASGTSGTRADGSTGFIGQYGNDAVVTATDTYGTDVSADDPSHYVATAPGITVEKSTNGDDADRAPGPRIPVGDPVAWQYVIENIGVETLTSITLVDDIEGDVLAAGSCVWDSGVAGTLAPGETATCDLTGATADPGEYVNVATVAGDGATASVTDQDPSHYYGVALDIDVEKSTNGQDADTPTGPTIGIGDTVSWVYDVTNTGNFPLVAWSVTDSDPSVAIACPLIPLFPGATVSCTATGTAQPGQYMNTATATAPNPFGGADPVDTDPSHYYGADPALDLEKSTNGEDADTPTGPFVPVGAPVTWEYVVTNNGNVAVTDLVVVDSDLGDITASCGTTTLAVGVSTTCSGDGTAITGQYTNVAIALGIGPLGTIVGDLDPSHYFGAASSIDIQKYTNGVDADDAPGVYIPVGDTVTWDYIVTNTGNDTLDSIAVSDDLEGPVTCSFDSLVPGDSGTCTLTGTAVRGQYANVGSVVGFDRVPQQVSDSDPSHYFGYISQIDVEKSTNGEDADTPTGPAIEVGQPVTWTYVVTNPGDLPIRNVTLTDDQGVVPVFIGGDSNNDSVLDPGEVWTYEATDTAVAGQYANIATVTGDDLFEEPLTDSDPSHYIGFEASIAIEKTPDVEVVDFGAPHTFTIQVTNTGDSLLTDVTVTDPVTPSCDRDLGTMQPGEVRTYTCDVASVTEPITNVAFVEGTALDGTPRTDDDDAFVGPFAVGGTGAIGDTVWSDENGNGVQDAGEAGIAGARVTVRFVSGPTPPITQNAEQVYSTDANGTYLAEGLVEGVWEAEIDLASVEGSLTTPGRYTITLGVGERFLDADFGLEDQLPVTGSDLDPFLVWGLILLGAGVAIVLVTLRRRTE